MKHSAGRYKSYNLINKQFNSYHINVRGFHPALTHIHCSHFCFLSIINVEVRKIRLVRYVSMETGDDLDQKNPRLYRL